jgi:hypothetical protein
MNARFWDNFHGDLVKITLKPGQTLSWSESHPTDEGYNSEAVTYIHHPNGIIRYRRVQYEHRRRSLLLSHGGATDMGTSVRSPL